MANINGKLKHVLYLSYIISIVKVTLSFVFTSGPRARLKPCENVSVQVRNRHNSSSSSRSKSSGGKSPTSSFSGFTKTPRFFKQLKYLFPSTEPSFFPVGSSSSTPTHNKGGRSVSSGVVSRAFSSNWDGISGTGPT